MVLALLDLHATTSSADSTILVNRTRWYCINFMRYLIQGLLRRSERSSVFQSNFLRQLRFLLYPNLLFSRHWNHMDSLV